MGNDTVLSEIRQQLNEANAVFFQSAWKDKMGEMLTEASRFTSLVEFCNEEIELRKIIITVLNPINDYKEYEEKYFKTYNNAIGEIAILIQLKEMLLDSKCTNDKRACIEKIICKIFKTHYNEELKMYV